MQNWRFLDTGYNDCYINMAIDEAMFLEYALGNIPPTLRIYGWNPPALSLGHVQDPKKELNLLKCQQEGVSFVRRITGGGVIFHHNELTYSIACSLDDVRDLATNMTGTPSISKFDISVRGVYKIICSFLINAYAKLGLDAQFAIEYAKTHKIHIPSSDAMVRRRDHFCFASNELYDIVVNGKKLGGNAQRRRKNLIFQHGSIPLKLDLKEAASFMKIIPLGLEERVSSLNKLLNRNIEFEEFKGIAKEAFENTFSIKLSKGSFTKKEELLVEELKQNKYTKSKWNLYGRK